MHTSALLLVALASLTANFSTASSIYTKDGSPVSVQDLQRRSSVLIKRTSEAEGELVLAGEGPSTFVIRDGKGGEQGAIIILKRGARGSPDLSSEQEDTEELNEFRINKYGIENTRTDEFGLPMPEFNQSPSHQNLKRTAKNGENLTPEERKRAMLTEDDGTDVNFKSSYEKDITAFYGED